MKSLTGKVAVVTGAAHGVGRELAVRLAEEGCILALVDLDHQNLKQIAERLTERTQCSTHVVDMGKKEQIKALVNRIIELHSRVDILINNAAVSVVAPLHEQTEDDIEWITNLNYLGVLFACRFFLPFMINQGEGHIVNVSSAAGLQGFPEKSTYCASKAALTGLSESLRTELRAQKIGVSVVYLGPVKTSMISRSRIKDPVKKDQIDKYLKEKGTDPGEVAHRIISGIKRNQPKIYISSQARTTALIKRLFPSLFGEWIAKFQDKLPA